MDDIAVVTFQRNEWKAEALRLREELEVIKEEHNMSGAERDNHNSKAYVAALRQIAELRPDQGHEAIRQAREVLGMEEERWGCFFGAAIEQPFVTCVKDDDAFHTCLGGNARHDCSHWRKY